MRATARQLRDKICLAAIFVSGHQDVSSGPVGDEKGFRTPDELQVGVKATKKAQTLFFQADEGHEHRPLNGPFLRGRFHRGEGARKLPISVNGAFPLLNGPWPRKP